MARRYSAFISYSHAEDEDLTAALQRSLQRFARPWNRPVALRIFRDATDLSINPALWSSVEQGIATSEHFLLLASPEAAASKWVSREIEYWKRNRSADKLLLILTAGEIVWRESSGDFDWEQTTALPKELAGFFHDEPRYIDLRWARGDQYLLLQNARFRGAIAEIAAPLHGKTKSELESDEVRQSRRIRRLTWSGIAVLASLLTAAVIAAVVAVGSAQEAKEQTQLAEERQRIATARLLSNEARSILANTEAGEDVGTRLVHSALLSVESLKMDPTPQGIEAIYRSLALHPTKFRSFDGEYNESRIALSDGGRFLAASLRSGVVRIWDVSTGNVLRDLSDTSHAVAEISISGDGRFVAWALKAEPQTIVVADVESGADAARLSLSLPLLALALSENGSLLAFSDREGIKLIDLQKQKAPEIVSSDGLVASLSFSEDGNGIAAVWPGGRIEVLSTEAGDRQIERYDVDQLVDENRSRFTGVVSGDARRVVTDDEMGTIQVWNTATLAEIARFEKGFFSPKAFSPGGDFLAAVSNDRVLSVWALQDAMLPIIVKGPLGWYSDVDNHMILSGDGEYRLRISNDTLTTESIEGDGSTHTFPVLESVSALSANYDGSRIAVSDGYWVTRIYNTGAPEEVTTLRTPSGAFGGLVGALALSGNGSRVAVGGDFEILFVYDIPSGRRLLELTGNRGPASRRLVFAIDDAGKRVATVTPEAELIVYDLEDTREPSKRVLPSRAYRLAFSKDGNSIAAVCLDRTLQVWNAVTLEEEARIPFQFTVCGLAFGEADSRLRILSCDGTVREAVWRPEDVIDRACAVLGRNFSESEWSLYFPGEEYRPICR